MPFNRWIARLAGPVPIVVGALTLTLLPPAEGAMLVMTWGAMPAAAVLDGDTSLLGAGPLPGSLVVRGTRDELLPALLTAGGIAVAAPALLCRGAAA